MQENDLSAARPRRGGRRKGSGKRADASAPWSLRAIQAMADGTRWSMIRYLSTCDATVGQIAGELGRSVACTSKHLSILNEVGVVTTTRRGRAVVCHLAEPGSQAGDLLRVLGFVAGERSSRPESVRPPSSHAPEFEPRHSNRYPSKDMDDFLV
jgi:hypothetical protein